MNISFDGRVVVITGASVGIGRACAIRFAEGGAHLALVDVNESGLSAVCEEVRKLGAEALTFICDISDEQAVNAVADEIISKFGKIDVLVNNAGLWRDTTAFVDAKTELWRRYFDVNVLGTMFFTRAVLPVMMENSYGRIINVASVAGVYGNRNMVHYSMTKGALISMAQSLAKEVANYGITVNCTSPGTVTPSTNDDINYTQPSELQYIGRTGSGAENADLICFLASESAGYISGQNILIDGCRKKL